MVASRMMKAVSVLIILSFVLIQFAHADQQKARAYLPAGSVNAEKLIDGPPAIGSDAFNEQMAIVLWLQKTRTPEQVAFVEKTLNVERFAPILGKDLMQVNGAALKALIDDAIDEVRADYDAVKANYDLPRPFQVSDKVKPVGDARPVASYPSGHSIRAIVYARLLAAVFPQHEAALLDLAKRVGYGRVVAGVHYPVDVTSGQILGNAYSDVIVKQPAFRKAIADLKAGP